MMGRLKIDQGQLFYKFHLGDAVPEDHLVRKIDAALDLSWLRSELAAHYSSIRTKLQIEGRARDLAMFNLAIDSKLRGCDVVTIRVEDVAAGGYTADRATVRQRKTGRPVRFELSEQTRQVVDDYVKAPANGPASSCSPAVGVRAVA